MRRTLEAIGLPIQECLVIISKQHTVVRAVSAAPGNWLFGAAQSASTFNSELKPDDLDVKAIAISDRSGFVFDRVLVWQAVWEHGGHSTPPQLIEVLNETSTPPRV